MDKDSLPRWKSSAQGNMASTSSSLQSLESRRPSFTNGTQRHDRESQLSLPSTIDSTLVSSYMTKKHDGQSYIMAPDATPDAEYPLIAPRLHSTGVKSNAGFSDDDDDRLVSHCIVSREIHLY
jgi:hypothetical protein